MTTRPTSLFDKLWDRHVVTRLGERHLLYIDLHLIFEGTSRESFAALDAAGQPLRRPELTLGTVDHFVPTLGTPRAQVGPETAMYLDTFEANCRRHGVRYSGYRSSGQGIVHVIGPEEGYTLPGMSIVCGDSHTSTHGALGALAFGIGTTQVRHVMAAQSVLVSKPRSMRVVVDGQLSEDVTSKDLALYLISRLGNLAAVGHAVEFAGPAVQALSIEGRMTLCNMGVELGASMTMIAPDEMTFAYLRGRPAAPAGDLWNEALADWRHLVTEPGAAFDQELRLDASAVQPFVTWGNLPSQAVPIDGRVPVRRPDADNAALDRALEYMDLVAGTDVRGIPIDAVFIGSCTNGRLEDLRSAAAVLRERRVASGVKAVVVPGSMAVRQQAEAEGLAAVFRAAGMEWREPGCSFCVAANGDIFPPGTRCVSTSNRNFEGRQGAGVRTHLSSPAVAAASAVAGHICRPADLSVAGAHP